VRRRTRTERGSAIVEFHFLGILLLVPLVYIMIAVLDVQRTAYGVTQAAREAGRLYVATGDEGAARAAAAVSLRDQDVDPSAVRLTFTCSLEPCHQPGAEVTVTVESTVPLPLIPDVLASAGRAQVPVSATHTAVVDRFMERSS
jgi:Flp pilus assembly protein TadG